jgi:hypothetical protein
MLLRVLLALGFVASLLHEPSAYAKGPLRAAKAVKVLGVEESREEIAPELVRKLESQLIMPRSAQPLDRYDRYYASAKLQVDSPTGPKSLDVVEGVFLQYDIEGHRSGAAPVEGAPGAFIVRWAQLPMIADGGCSVITVFFDRTAKRFVQAGGDQGAPAASGVCNGVA